MPHEILCMWVSLTLVFSFFVVFASYNHTLNHRQPIPHVIPISKEASFSHSISYVRPACATTPCICDNSLFERNLCEQLLSSTLPSNLEEGWIPCFCKRESWWEMGKTLVIKNINNLIMWRNVCWYYTTSFNLIPYEVTINTHILIHLWWTD